MLGVLLVAGWAGYSRKTEQGVVRSTPAANVPASVLTTQQGAQGAELSSSEYPTELDSSVSSELKMQDVSSLAASDAQTHPAVALDTVNMRYMVVWANQSDITGSDIHGALYNSDGSRFSSEDIIISEAYDDQKNPSVAFDGNRFLVVWQDENISSSDIHGALVDEQGPVPGFADILLTDAINNQVFPKVVFRKPDALFKEPQYLVVWQDTRSDDGDIYGTRVSVDGFSVDGSGVPLAPPTGVQGKPAIAVGETHSLLVWEQDSGSANAKIRGTLLPAGDWTPGFDFGVGTGSNARQTAPSVAFHAASNNYFVVWSDARNTATGNDIYGTRVSSGGTVWDASGFPISNGPGAQLAPAIATAGDNVLAVWQDARDSSINDIFGNRLSADGGVVAGSDFSIRSTTYAQTPAVGPVATDKQLVFYSAPNPGTSSPKRIQSSLINSRQRGSTCSQNQECASGYCVDGVCCNSACDVGSTGNCRACSVATGAQENGICKIITSGNSCEDGNKCTRAGTCQQGKCIGTDPVICADPDQCHETGACNPATGICSFRPKPNGTACADDNACTIQETCQEGNCTGKPVICKASDQCHEVGICNKATGDCTNPRKSDGTSCSDGNACTRSDTCQGGLCTGSEPVTCTASDQCHDVGTCNPATGSCSNPAKDNGAYCSDGNTCTRTDTCQAGVCRPGAVAAEVCNRVDDNCDGRVDNITPLYCSPRECRVGKTYCTTSGGNACAYTANSLSKTRCSIGSCDGKGLCCGNVRTLVAARKEYEVIDWVKLCSGWLWWRNCTWYPVWGWRYYPAHYVNKYKCK